MSTGPRRFLTGAFPSPRHKLAAAAPYQIVGDTPPQFARIPIQLSYWGNDQYGNCVTVEEAYAKACYDPEIFIQDPTVMAFCKKYNLLYGADLITVLTLMRSDGFHQDSQSYNDGPPTSVDWTNDAVLQNSIFRGPVKIGVASRQFQGIAGDRNGWFALNFQRDPNMDHCVGLSGYGPISFLAEQLGVSVPLGVDPTQLGYHLFTWNSVGIINSYSLRNVTHEAWLRVPTTLGTVPPTPPVPPIQPAPSWTPEGWSGF